MSIHIQARGFPLSKALKAAVEKHMLEILVSHEGIRGVDVRLEDINGKHRGGVDKRCQVILKQDNAPALILRSTQADMYLAIRNCAAGRPAPDHSPAGRPWLPRQQPNRG
jgi:ribosome-associated translation inhibitor RaiA